MNVLRTSVIFNSVFEEQS